MLITAPARRNRSIASLCIFVRYVRAAVYSCTRDSCIVYKFRISCYPAAQQRCPITIVGQCTPRDLCTIKMSKPQDPSQLPRPQEQVLARKSSRFLDDHFCNAADLYRHHNPTVNRKRCGTFVMCGGAKLIVRSASPTGLKEGRSVGSVRLGRIGWVGSVGRVDLSRECRQCTTY